MKTGPVEIVEAKGVKIPIYSTPSRGKENYIMTYYAEGERKRERAGTTLEKARETAKAKIAELTRDVAHVGQLTPRQAAVVADSLEILRGINIPMSQACREYAEGFRLLGRQPLIVKACEHYAAYLEKQKTMHAPQKFQAVVDEFLEAIESKAVPLDTSKIKEQAEEGRQGVPRIPPENHRLRH